MVFKKYSKSILKKIFFVKTFGLLNGKQSIVFSKDSYIPNSFKNINIKIYKGNVFRNLLVDKFNIGLKFGNFVFTRKPHSFVKKKKKSSNSVRR